MNALLAMPAPEAREAPKVVKTQKFEATVTRFETITKEVVIPVDKDELMDAFIDSVLDDGLTYKQVKELVMDKMCERVIIKHYGNQTQASKAIGVTRGTLRKALVK